MAHAAARRPAGLRLAAARRPTGCGPAFQSR